MALRSTSDFVVPHQLCRYCTALVEEATCLKHNLSDLLPLGFDPQNDWDPVQHTIEAYPGIRTIVRSANGGCHLCSIIIHGMSHTAVVKNSLNSRSEGNAMVFAMITLIPEERGRDCSFELILYRGRRPWQRDLSQEKIRRVDLHRVKNQEVMDCQNCKSCFDSFSPFQKNHGQQYAHYRWVEYTGSTTSTQMMRTWLDSCLKCHDVCTVEGLPQRPTRLLDLGGPALEGDIRLIPGSEAQSQSYATLSYCWGVCKTTVLDRTNFDESCRCIKFKNLPRTLQHAVIVCRRLAIPYLWIDALCIIQGSDGDWDTEASLMGSVYAGSTLTIAAANAGESNDGFLHYRSPLRQQDCRLFRDATHTVFAAASSPCCRLGSCPGNSRLDTRGWVLQERLLSPRTLYFGPYGVHWECRGGNLCEEQPSFRHDSLVYATHTKRRHLIKSFYRTLCDLAPASDGSEAQGDFISCWNRIIEIYSPTKLSFDSDKLVAIAGIASLFQDRLHLQASYGLWLSCFDIQLLWRTSMDPDLRSYSRNDLAPTWSWASVTGAILKLQEYVKHRSVMVTFDKLPSLTAFSRAGNLPPARSLESTIRLKGMLQPCLLSDSWREDNPRGMILPAWEAENPYQSFCFFQADVPFDAGSSPLYCLPITKYQHGSDDDIFIDSKGLVLTPDALCRNRYRRIGYFDMDIPLREKEHDMFTQTFPQSSIELV